MPPSDDLDDETAGLVRDLAERLSNSAHPKQPWDPRLRAVEARLSEAESRLLDIEDARSKSTIRREVEAEVNGDLWTEVRKALIRWGIPATFGVGGWAFVQFIKSVT